MSSRTTPRCNQAQSKRHPPGETPKSVNSGISLKVKESTVELKNFIEQWNKLHLSGVLVLSSIKALKMDSMSCNPLEQNYPQGLQERCDQLQNVINKMQLCLANLAILVQQFNAMVELNSMQGGNNSPIYLSWSTSKFREAYHEIYDTYSKELSLKTAIKEEISGNKLSRKKYDDVMKNLLSKLTATKYSHKTNVLP